MRDSKQTEEKQSPQVISLVDYALEYLAGAIISGELKPGEQIKEEDVASRLGISRPPLREAFKALEMEGLVVRRPRKGVFVSEIKEKDVWEIYTLKMALYGLATYLAVGNAASRDLQRLERIVERMEGCLAKRPPDVSRYQLYHEEFHGLIMDIAGNQRLKKIALSLHNQVKRFSYRSLTHEEHLRNSCMRHREILQALRERNPGRAEDLSRQHVMEALEFLRRILAGGISTCLDKGRPQCVRPMERAI
jgi:DNA-binding GntR family transcriptional regulator